MSKFGLGEVLSNVAKLYFYLLYFYLFEKPRIEGGACAIAMMSKKTCCMQGSGDALGICDQERVFVIS